MTTSEVPTIVVVDDAVDVRNLVKVRLRLSRRFDVVGEGANGVEAVALAQLHQPSLFLLDVSMPLMDGLEALPRILEASPRTRVVLYSGFDERGLAERGRQLGAAAFLEKSASVERLADDLSAVLAAAGPSSSPVPAGTVLDDTSPPATVPAVTADAAAAPAPEGASAREERRDRDDERLLGQHLERFREVFEEAAIGMATLTLTGQIVRANKALAALLGRTAGDLVGVSYADVAPGAAADVGAAVATLCHGLVDVVHVQHEVDRGARGRRVDATFAAVRGEQRQPLYLFLQAQDVTEQQRATEELRQSEERFRLLVDAVEDYAIFMLDPQGRVMSWNAGAQRIKGYAAEDVIGRHFRLFYPRDKQVEGHPEWELEVALREGHYEEEGWRVRKDGTRFWANVLITAVRNAGGDLVGFAKVTRDMSDRRSAEENLRQSEERFRLLVEAVEDYAIFMLDPHGRVASWNAGAQRIKGYAADEVIGRHFRLFYPRHKQAEGHPEWELELALREGHYEEEGWRVRKDGTRFWANVLITAVRNPGGDLVGFAKVTRDITERRTAEEQQNEAAGALAGANEALAAMNDRLARAAAGQAEFLAITAHELRGPVGVIGGSVDTLAQHWGDLTDDERGDMFAGMVSSAGRLRRLLGDLLTTARLEAGAVVLDRHAVRLADVLTAAAAAAAQAQPSLQVEVHCPADLEVVVDRDRLAQAVENLLTNVQRHGAPPVRLTAAATGDAVEIRVSDGGPGVPPEMRRRLFDRFATGEPRSGTGLGLFIVRELARAHGGDAWYDEGDTPGGGHSFVLSLPPS